MKDPRNEREAHQEMDWSAHTREPLEEWFDALEGGRPGSEGRARQPAERPIWRDVDWIVAAIVLVLLAVGLWGCASGDAAVNPFETTLPVNCAATQGVCK